MTAITFGNVTYGKTNHDVKLFQQALIAHGCPIAAGPTGYYGGQTKKACAAFQRAQGWSGGDADGVPGPKTFSRLGLTSKTIVGRIVAAISRPGRVKSPVPGYGVNYPFGVRNSRYAAGFHTGEDHAAPTGTPVVAVRSGTVAWSNGNGGAYGNWIGLRADNGHVYMYAHLSSRSVSAGQKVAAGQHLGKVGATGNVTGPHLHFEMSRGSTWSYGSVQKPTW